MNETLYVYKGDLKKKIHAVDKAGWIKEGWLTEKPNQPDPTPLKLESPVPTETRKRVVKEAE